MRKQNPLTAALNCDLTVSSYTEYSDKITSPVRIALLSDLHSTIYGDKQQILLSAVRRQRPDLILMAGDIADHKVSHHGTCMLLDGIGKTWPCFYASGNHEHWTREMPAIRKMFTSRNITVLSGGTVPVTVRGQTLLISGVDDPHAFVGSHHTAKVAPEWKVQFRRCRAQITPALCSILISHRPELTKYYADSGFDLVVAGHAHGGQVRLPGCKNGLLAPHQGFFPKYAGGRYQLGNTVMIVSRGLCLNRLPRICNPPEVVMIELRPRSLSPLPVFQTHPDILH